MSSLEAERGVAKPAAEQLHHQAKDPNVEAYIDYHLIGASEAVKNMAREAIALSPEERHDVIAFLNRLLEAGVAQAQEAGAANEFTTETIDDIRDQIRNFNGSRNELAALTRKLGEANYENPGMIDGTPAGSISAERAAKAIEDGFGGNVSDPELQQAADRVYANERQTEGIESLGSVREAIKNFSGGTRAELAALVRKLGALNTENPNMIFSQMAGNISAERAATAIEEGRGGNISDADIQNAVSRTSD